MATLDALSPVSEVPIVKRVAGVPFQKNPEITWDQAITGKDASGNYVNKGLTEPAQHALDEWKAGTWKQKVDWYVNNKVDLRTYEALRRERSTFFVTDKGPGFSRWLVILPVLMVQICMGSLYCWSIFNKTMDKVWVSQGYKTGANANAFTIAVAFFGYGAALYGPWISRYGSFYSVRNTLICLPLGWAGCCLATSNDVQSLGLLYASCIFMGTGLAFGYTATCSCIQAWFPEFKAAFTGLAVMGFGVGSTIWTNVGKTLMNTQGYTVSQTQGIFAAIFLCGIALAFPFMRQPPPGYKPDLAERFHGKPGAIAWVVEKLATPSKANIVNYEPLTLSQAVRTLEFALVLIFMVGQSVGGVVFISSAADMASNLFGKNANDAADVATSLTIANFVGRAVWGAVSDRMGRKTFYLMSTSVQAFSMGLIILWIQQNRFELWQYSFILVGMFYGGGFGVIPAFVSDLFGPAISAATHGLVLAVWATTSIVGTPIFTSVNDANKVVPLAGGAPAPGPAGYMTNAKWMCALPCISFFAILLLNTRTHDRTLRQRIGGLRCRLLCLVGVCSVRDIAQQEEDWADYLADKEKERRVAELEKLIKNGGSIDASSYSSGVAKPASVVVAVPATIAAVPVAAPAAFVGGARAVELPAVAAPTANPVAAAVDPEAAHAHATAH